MATTIYATSGDYVNYTGASAAPANIAQLLSSASRIVRRDTITAVYDVDDTGAPTDATVIAALRDATCAQAAAWAALGINPLAGGVVTSSKVVSAKSLDGASVTYVGAQAAANAAAAVVDDLVPDAVDILQDAGLFSSWVGDRSSIW